MTSRFGYITAISLSYLIFSMIQITVTSSSMPIGMPIPGSYNGTLRPQVHYSPPQYFMNDPNGMFVDANGTWHLYYQYNPNGIIAGDQHWGHATSQDLYHWLNQPIALFPPDNETFVFSGSAVVDVNNTSGFFPNQNNGVVAMYTLAQYHGGQPGPQTQNIACSHDGGYSFIPYSGNPVIPSNSSQFRDPKVVWYQDHWVVVISFAQDYTVGFYTSPDLKTWTHVSNFSGRGLLGLQYECPNLVQMPVQGTSEILWVLQISINPGAPLGGSIAQYFPGTFNGTHFTAIDDVTRIADFGKDNYAGQFFSGIPVGSDAISIAWASNWEYTQLVPTGPQEGWRSTMSLPRRNFLTNITRVGMVMASAPYKLSSVLGDTLLFNSSLGNGTISLDYSTVPSNAVYLVINATNVNSSLLGTDSTVNFTFSSPVSKEYLTGGFFFGGDQHFFLDRGGTHGFVNPFFTDKISTTNVIGPDGMWSVEVLIDRSIIELFLDGGTRSATQTFFPTQPLTTVEIRAGGIKYGMELAVQVSAVISAWARYADKAGYVVGNMSSSTTGNNSQKRSIRVMG